MGFRGGAELEEAESGLNRHPVGHCAMKQTHQGHRISCPSSAALAMSWDITKWEDPCSWLPILEYKDTRYLMCYVFYSLDVYGSFVFMYVWAPHACSSPGGQKRA